MIGQAVTTFAFIAILRMKITLVITGLLAGIAIALPELVLLGYFLLIVPGLVLTFAPTAFAYVAMTAIVRRLLPISSTVVGTLVAFGVALLLGWVVMQPFRVAMIDTYRLDELPDVELNHAIELNGNVRIERLDERGEPECDYLSLAILDSPLVQSLTTVTSGSGKPLSTPRSAAYTLVWAREDSQPGVFPSEPGQLVREYLPLAQANRGQKFFTASKAVEADWAMRLSGAQRLRKTQPVDAEAVDWLIQVESQTNRDTGALRRITITDSQGTVRFRKSYRKQAIPAWMFYVGFRANMSGGGASASFHVGRQILESGERSLKPESELLHAIKFPVPRCDAGVVDLLRDQAVEALNDPTATAVQLDLARRYLGLFFFDSKEHDYTLIGQIVADDRIRDIDSQIQSLFSKNKMPIELKDAYVQRIVMDHTSASLRHYLAECLASLPTGTFANPGPYFLSIWNSPEIYQQSAPLIATLADLGPDLALPKLDDILDTTIGLPSWSKRREVVKGIREALIRLGPLASTAAPRIRELFLRRPSPIMNNAGDADQWRFALARMGIAIEDLPVFPNQSPQSVERNLQKVASQLQRYERDFAPANTR